MKVATKQDKTFLIKVLQNSLGWSESQLRSFREESLNELYDYLLKGHVITKAKSNNKDFYYIVLRIPNKAMEHMDINKNERFDILINIHRKEIILDRNKVNRIKVCNQNKIYLPYKLAEKNLLKPNDDTAVISKGNRIILKSFTYFQ